MRNSKLYEDLSILFKRSRSILVLVIVIFLTLVVFLWKLQILDYRKYLERSEANRIREVVVPAQRGLITDRDGRILAKNVASFRVSFIRENCADIDESCLKISRLLDLTPEQIRARIRKYESIQSFKPVVIKGDLTAQEIARIEAYKLEMPELILQAEPKREYPFTTFASHVLGYLQEISIEELRSGYLKKGGVENLIGKTGLEKQYEEMLAGDEGRILHIVDSVGREKGILFDQEPEPGENIRLTIDYDLQSKAEDLLKGKEGVIILLSPKTGQVLCMASYPGFDPNGFIRRFSPEEWNDIIERKDFPLENRAIRGLYSPGSIFKLTMALTALDMQVVNEWTSFFCDGEVYIYGHPFSCWFEEGHGATNIFSSIQHSCNIYYYQLGRRIDIEDIARYARELGLGALTGIDLPNEKSGLVPDRAWKKKSRNAPWYPGETISVSIGQGPVLVTPLQIACHTAILANRGKKITPHLLLSEDGQEDFSLNIKASLFEKVIKGMWQAVNSGGTARAAHVDGSQICGKTGSTQLVSRETAEKGDKTRKEYMTHSWFTGFAPRNDPKVVVTVIVEYGGMGGETAAPLAKEMFELFGKKYD